MTRTWSIFNASPSIRRASAGIMSPSFTLIMSPGTSSAASISIQVPSRSAFALGASLAMRAAAALPALFSSMKEIVELTSNSRTIPRKSYQSGGSPCSSQNTGFRNILNLRQRARESFIRTYSSIGKSYGHNSGSLHDPRQRVPHEAQKFQYLAFLHITQPEIGSVKMGLSGRSANARTINLTFFSSNLL